jgi:thioredoxin-like negative regulator of GroEL
VSTDNHTSLQTTLRSEKAILLYFSHHQCSVCKVLQPKIEVLLKQAFPRMQFKYINTMENPEVAASFQVFAAPTVLLYFDGKEHARFSRNMGLDELKTAIERPYQILFE